MAEPVNLTGSIERITFYNDENGYTVARFVAEAGAAYAGRELITVIGNMLGVNVGEPLRLEGVWINNPKYGRQFKVERYTVELPTTTEGIRRYLGSGLIKGIGPVTAERIVKTFGDDTLNVIENDIGRLREVGGVGPKRIDVIRHGWAAQQQIKQVMLFLQSYGITTGLAAKIYKAYGDGALAVVRNEPYRLARDIYGIGFVTADRLARALGMLPDAPARIEAGVRHVLGMFSDEGHVFALRPELLQKAALALDVDGALVDAAIDRLAARADVVVEETAVYLAPFQRAEMGAANRVRGLISNPHSRLAEFQSADWSVEMARLRAEGRITLTGRQQDAVRCALTAKLTVLTGGPGTGKTTTVRGLIELLKAHGRTFRLAAPTGRAAKRLAEATGEPAQTLHRLLEFKPQFDSGGHFARDRDNPLDADLIIVDEVSMIDILLMNALLRAVDLTSHLLLVGDPDQLPSVGAGNVLKDLIAASRAAPAQIALVALDTIFRQSEESLIIANAHRINHGEMPRFTQAAKDFYLFKVAEPEAASARVVKLLTESIPRKFGLDPVDDVQVLSPMHRGAAGVAQLNLALQAALNPPAPAKREWRAGGRVFRAGDKVLQTRNNYEKQVFNGDLGRVRAIDLEEQTVTVDFDGVLVPYEVAELDELTHAFAMSVHKSQGSEYKAVVLLLLPQHYMLLQRNLLYTAVTRARALVVIVGAPKAIAMAVKNDTVARRNSRLAERLA